MLELVGLRDRAKDKVSAYSLGMKQRLAIAAAMLSDPQLLLLDEPANGLDPAGIVAMRDTLRHLASTGRTVFVSSHILGEVQQLADVVGIIAAGKLVREAPIGVLLSSADEVRVKVMPVEMPRALTILEDLAAGSAAATPNAEGWISVRVGHERAAEINRALGQAGIYASGLESGNDLESLFLALTGGEPAPGGDGAFQRVAS
jgi:ABC-2 type transport system ATP-binding protein